MPPQHDGSWNHPYSQGDRRSVLNISMPGGATDASYAPYFIDGIETYQGSFSLGELVIEFPEQIALYDISNTSGTLDMKQDLTYSETLTSGYISTDLSVPVVCRRIKKSLALSPGTIGDIHFKIAEPVYRSSSYTLTINDNDDSPSIAWSSSTYSSSESSESIIITATMSGISSENVMIDYSITDINATGFIDYTLTSGMLTIPSGSINTTLTVELNNDSIFEPTESFTVQMIAYTNVIAGGITATTIDILDNDTAPEISWNPISSTVSENSGSIQITATLSMISGLSASADYTVSGTASSGLDYTLANGTITIPAGSTEANITIEIDNDLIDENDDLVFIHMIAYTNVNAGNSTVYTLTITDDDNPPYISFNPISKNSAESIGIVSINTKLSHTSEKPISADFGVIGGTASSLIDYTLISGTVNFVPGTLSKAITCTIADDAIEEIAENIIIGLSNFVNVLETTGSGSSFTLTIEDNDSPIYISPVSEKTSNINTAISIVLRVTQTEALPLTLLMQSSDSGLISVSNISITGTGAVDIGSAYTLGVLSNIEDYTATITPETDASGSCQITFTVIAPTGVSDESTFILNITDGTPEISNLVPQTTLENLAISVILSITDTIDGVLSITGVASDGLLVSSQGLQLTHPSMSGASNSYTLSVSRNIPETITITINPELDSYGNSEISITITNLSGISTTESFMLTVVDAASRSIAFDGIDDHIISDAVFSMEPTNAIAIEAWIYLYTNTTDMAILSYGNSSHESISFEHRSYNLEMRLKNSSNSEFVNFRNLSADAMAESTWYHICVMWNNTLNTAYFFLNGQLRYESTFSSDSIGYSGNRQLYIGSFLGQSKWFKGRLDEIRLWKTALQISTIRGWMFKSLTDSHPNYTQLVAYYPISSVDGLQIFDTCNNHHGFLYENSVIGSGPTRSQQVAVNSWQNVHTNDWNDPENWSGNFVPTATNPGFVFISKGIRKPVLNEAASVNNLVLPIGASYQASTSFPLTVHGRIYNNRLDTSNINIGNSLTIFSSLDFKTDRIAPETGNPTLTITSGEAINIQWNQATDDISLSTNLEYAVVMSTHSQACLEALGQIAANISPCEIETVIPFQIVSGSGSGETIRNVSGNIVEVDISGLSSNTYYFNVVVRDEMNNLAVYDSESIVFSISPTSNETFWVSPFSDYVNALWYIATDNVTPQEDIKYSIYYTTHDRTCLENLDQMSPQTGPPCNVVIPNSQEVASGTWDSGTRGTNIQTMYGGSQLTVDVEGLTSNTIHFFTIIAEDDDGNKFQYDIVQTMTSN